MPILTIGNTEIPYRIRYSDRARKKRIVVTARGVEVVAPTGAPLDGDQGVAAFVFSKRRWLFDAVREVAAQQGKLLTQYYAGGAKLQFRGRWLMLDVQSGATRAVTVTCKSKFHVTAPETLEGAEKLMAVRQGLEDWLKRRAARDLASFCRLHAPRLGVHPKGARLSDARHTWGACGKDGIIRIHWRLIQAPKLAMEYVVAHELTHLRHRNHGPAFWKKLSETLPNWAEAKALLERWEGEHRAV